MSRELADLLTEAVPTEVGGPDLDAIESRALRRRRTTGAAAVLAILAVVFGVSQLVDLRPSVPVVGQDDLEESMLRETGAFDRGTDETLHLNPDTDQRLHGQLLAELDGLGRYGREIAVGADRAIGVRDDAGMRILLDGTQIAARDVAPPSEDVAWRGQRSVAFDTDGTLWGLDGRTVVGLRRDGTTIDIEDAFEPARRPGEYVGLRVTGTNVSVVLYTQYDPDFAVVVSVIGEDPLDGPRAVDSPFRLAGESYIDGARAILTPRLLLAGSIVGTARTELDWQAPPSDADGYSATGAESQIVADTAASLLEMSIYDGSFLIVQRADGLAAAALVGGGTPTDISISPDGAVHLITWTGAGSGTTTIRTLLDADLQPLQGPPIVSDTTTDGPRPPLECREPAERDQVVDNVDLDGDGTDDQVTLHRDGVILACLADGTVTAVAAHPPSEIEEEGASQSIAAADLGGTDGIIVTLQTAPDVPFHIQNYLLRLDQGELGIVGDSSVSASGLPDVEGLTHYGEGWDFPTGADVDQGSADSLGLLGCRPSVLSAADFDAITLIHNSAGRLSAEIVSVTGLEVTDNTISQFETIPGLPDTAARDELDQVLRDMGFTPGCRPAT